MRRRFSRFVFVGYKMPLNTKDDVEEAKQAMIERGIWQTHIWSDVNEMVNVDDEAAYFKEPLLRVDSRKFEGIW